MQCWITVWDLSGWKIHFITLQLEFFNFLSLASGKLDCFAVLAVGLDVSLKSLLSLKGPPRVAWLSLWSPLASDTAIHLHLASAECKAWQKWVPSRCVTGFSCLTSTGFSAHTSPTGCLHYLFNTSCVYSAYSCWQFEKQDTVPVARSHPASCVDFPWAVLSQSYVLMGSFTSPPIQPSLLSVPHLLAVWAQVKWQVLCSESRGNTWITFCYLPNCGCFVPIQATNYLRLSLGGRAEL